MRRTAEDRVEEQHIQPVQIGSEIRVCRKPNHRAAPIFLDHNQRLVRKLLARLFPEVAAGKKLIGAQENRCVHSLVQFCRREDRGTLNNSGDDCGQSGTQPVVGIRARTNDGAGRRVGQFGIRLNLFPVVFFTCQ